MRRLAKCELVRTGVLAPVAPFAVAVALWSEHRVSATLLYVSALVLTIGIAAYWARQGAGAGFVVVQVPLPVRDGVVREPDEGFDDLARRLVTAVVGGGVGHYDGEGLRDDAVQLYFVGRDLQRLAGVLRRSLRQVGVQARVTVS